MNSYTVIARAERRVTGLEGAQPDSLRHRYHRGYTLQDVLGLRKPYARSTSRLVGRLSAT